MCGLFNYLSYFRNLLCTMSIGKEWKEHFERKLTQSQSQDKFEQAPVTPRIFFEVWMRQPLSPEQLKALESMFTPDFKDLSDSINELQLMWGEGAGKDFFSERLLIYTAYWLLCLRSPQAYLNRAEGTPIDLINTSVTEEHAANVFFKQFCEAIRLVINPATGHNWFEEQGMDIREGRDILTNQVRFPKAITAYSLNSVKYTGEGKNILVGVLDEIAEFKYDKAKALYGNLKATGTSRFPKYHKIILISYLRDEFDFMNTRYNEVDTLPIELKNKIYRSKKCTWEVNPTVKKEMYKDAYDTDPEDAARRYENKIPTKKSQKFIKDGNVILKAIRDYEGTPLISEDPRYSTDLNVEVFQPWFKPGMTKEIWDLELQYAKEPNEALKTKIEFEKERHIAGNYYIHIDLSKGSYDYAGIIILHDYNFTESQKGYYVDLVVQLRPKEEELDFEDVQKFIFKLSDMGFPIAKVTLDGWQCQSGDNELPLLNGTNKRIKDLISGDWVYAYDTIRNKIVPAQCLQPYKTGIQKDVFELLLDNGEKTKFTAEHPILMTDGTLKQVANLSPGDSIRSLELRYRSLWEGGPEYLQVYQHKQKGPKWQNVHRLVAIEEIHTPIKGEVVHHKDFNRFNNTPDNLQILSTELHYSSHKQLSKINGWKVSRALKNKPKSLEHNKAVSLGVKRQWARKTTKELTNLKVKTSLRLKTLWQDPAYRERMCVAHKGYHWKLQDGKRIFYRNHKVVSVSYVGKEDVYDVEIPKYHNMALKSGIFVHNSVMFIQGVVKKGIPCEEKSVDRTFQPYNTLKDLLYQGLISYYYNPILIRELNELLITPQKVDHPKDSNQRLKEEGVKRGSKDLADSLAGALFAASSADEGMGSAIVELPNDPLNDFNHKFPI